MPTDLLGYPSGSVAWRVVGGGCNCLASNGYGRITIEHIQPRRISKNISRFLSYSEFLHLVILLGMEINLFLASRSIWGDFGR